MVYSKFPYYTYDFDSKGLLQSYVCWICELVPALAERYERKYLIKNSRRYAVWIMHRRLVITYWYWNISSPGYSECLLGMFSLGAVEFDRCVVSVTWLISWTIFLKSKCVYMFTELCSEASKRFTAVIYNKIPKVLAALDNRALNETGM